MNLVSYEYVACQADNAGVLVLSEFAGAAQSLGAGGWHTRGKHRVRGWVSGCGMTMMCAMFTPRRAAVR
jgi:hypothetical protein